MATYTHNLKIILVDNNNDIIIDNEFLDEIKNALCKLNSIYILWNNTNLNVMIKWDKKNLNKVDNHFVGDLFLDSMYNNDSIITNHVKNVILCINNKSKHNIKIYISRLTGDKLICNDSYGVV